MAKPPIETEGPFVRAEPWLDLIRRCVIGTVVAAPLLFILGAVLRAKGIL